MGSAGDLNRDGQTTDRPILDGSDGENTRNTAFYTVDGASNALSIFRRTGRLILSADFFNLFNFDNVLIGSSNMAYGVGTTLQNGRLVAVAPPANFGQLRDSGGSYLLTNTPGDPFQAQIGLKWVF